MQKMSMAAITILLFVQILSNGFAQIPNTSDEETLEDGFEMPSQTSSRNNSSGNNTAPQVSSVIVTPSSPTETDVLACYYTYSDIDNDPDMSSITWSINGALTTSVGSTLSSGYTTGDYVTCTVSAYDGTDYGNTASTNVLIISNNTGGNNTGGNNTGGNNTGGNNTGGNNTGGNNTGGNNTGGNNTGGNNTGGNNTGGNNTGTHNDAHCLIVNNLTMNQTYYVTLDLVNTCSKDIHYPGINATADHSGVSGFTNQANWWYLIWANATYNMSWQLSFDSSVQNGTNITLDFEAVVLNCGANGTWHDCPNSSSSSLSYQFAFSSINNNNTGGNNNNSNCGNSSNLTDMMIWTDATTYTVGDTVYMGYDVNCTILGNSYTIDSWLRNTTTVLYGGSPWFGWTAQWNPMQFSDYNANFGAGDYCLNATLYEAGVFLDFEETCFTIVNSTGNGTGNNTGGNNSSNCGNDSNLTDLMVWTDATTYTVGDSVLGNFFVNCTVIGETYQLDYEVVEYNTNIEHADGEWNWTALNNWESFNPTWTGLPAGDYCIHSTLVIWTGSAYSFVDFVSSCFDILNSTTGGNNTGGNNTGGNNTGGNNTGGNNTSCMSSMQIVDGSVNITGVNSVYNIGDQFNGNLITCWIPSNTSMSLTAWLNSSNGINHDIQGYSGGNYWASNLGIQQLGPYGHWSFPISEHGSIFGMNYSSLNLPADDYCWEALLKVYDGNTFAPVDDDTACFTIQSNNTGGNNTGGNNTTNPCGTNSSLISVISWTDSSTYQLGDDQELNFYVNCTVIGNNYTLEYYVTEVGAMTWSHVGSWTWTAGQTYSFFTDIISGLGAGDYCVIGNLYEWNSYATDDGGNTCFTISAVNSPPSIMYTQQIPVAYSGDTLDCYSQNVIYSDPDNDPDQSIFTWNVNNVQISTGVLNNILPAGSFVVGDTVHCEAIAHDGMAQGNTMNRYYFVLPANNTAPSVSNVIITPASPTETDTLTCTYMYNDPDNDPDASTIQWSVNGVAVSGATTDTLSSGYATADFVTCAVTAFDGTVNGNTGTMTVLIMSSGSSSGGGGLPSIGVAGTIAAISAGFIFATRREDEE